MTLSDMANQVCADTGYLDTDDVAYAKTALRQRDELIYRMGLWKDSLLQVNVEVDPENDDDHAEGVLYLPEVIERVVAVRTADAFQRVSGLETFYRADFDKFGQTGAPLEFAKLAPAWFTWRNPQAGTGIHLVTEQAADAALETRVIWFDADGERHVTTDTLSALQLVSDQITIESWFKPVSTGQVDLWNIENTEELGRYLTAAETRSPLHQRIRLLPIPTSAVTVRVLGKGVYAPLTFDEQEPQVTGSHLALMAFAKHFLRKRGGEIAAAADDLQEAMALLERLKHEELQQEAHNQRFIPDSGYGDAFFGPGRDGFFVA